MERRISARALRGTIIPRLADLAQLIACVEEEKAKVRVVKIVDDFHRRAAFETGKDTERRNDQALRKDRFNGS